MSKYLPLETFLTVHPLPPPVSVTSHYAKKSGLTFEGGKEGTNLLILIACRFFLPADDGPVVLTREVADGASLLVGKKVSLSRSNHDVSAVYGVGYGNPSIMINSLYNSIVRSGDYDGGSGAVTDAPKGEIYWEC